MTTLSKPTIGLPRTDRMFFTGMALAAAITVFVGFAPTYFLKGLYGTPALPSTLVHLHGFLLTSWILLFLAQSTLILAKRTDLHRRLGVGGGLLAVAIVPVSLAIAVAAAKRGGSATAPPIPPLILLAFSFIDMTVFAVLVTAGLYNRRRSDTHKRLMLLATVSLLTAAIGRFFLPPNGLLVSAPAGVGAAVDWGLADVLVLTCMLYDVTTRRRVHPAFLWGGVFVIVAQHLRLFIGGTAAWLTFAGWLVG